MVVAEIFGEMDPPGERGGVLTDGPELVRFDRFLPVLASGNNWVTEMCRLV